MSAQVIITMSPILHDIVLYAITIYDGAVATTREAAEPLVNQLKLRYPDRDQRAGIMIWDGCGARLSSCSKRGNEILALCTDRRLRINCTMSCTGALYI